VQRLLTLKVGWHAWQLKTGQTMGSPGDEPHWVCSGNKLGLVDGDYPRTAAKVIIFYAFDIAECARAKVQELGCKSRGRGLKAEGRVSRVEEQRATSINNPQDLSCVLYRGTSPRITPPPPHRGPGGDCVFL
jgi:hypothetical protein